MRKEFWILFSLGLLLITIAGSLGGLFYYWAILNFQWYFTGFYAAIVCTSIVLSLIAYAMFSGALEGTDDADE
jgi:hypothetical protein